MASSRAVASFRLIAIRWIRGQHPHLVEMSGAQRLERLSQLDVVADREHVSREAERHELTRVPERHVVGFVR